MATTLWLLKLIMAQWIVIFYPGVLVFWLIMHNNIERLRPMGTRAYWVAAMAWIITAGPLLFFRSRIFSVQFSMPEAVRIGLELLGVLTLLLGAALLLQARKKIPLKTMVGLPEIAPDKNQQAVLNTGIYAKTRNPIYLAHWLLVLSGAALTNFAANWIMFALDCLVLPLLIRAEERELLARYGTAYLAYMRQVPRFFPQVR